MNTVTAAPTPGPWLLDPHADDEGALVIIADGADVARVSPRDGVRAGGIDPERDANASLIAASPDLLIALRAIHEVACYASEQNPEASEEMLRFIGQNARTAIAKARGAR